MYLAAAAAAKLLQSCPTLCDPIDGSPPGSPVPGILQARTLEWVAISFPSAWKVKVKSLSHVWLFATPWTAAYQAPPPMGFSRQEYWSGMPLPSPKCILKKGSFYLVFRASPLSAVFWKKKPKQNILWQRHILGWQVLLPFTVLGAGKNKEKYNCKILISTWNQTM